MNQPYGAAEHYQAGDHRTGITLPLSPAGHLGFFRSSFMIPQRRRSLRTLTGPEHGFVIYVNDNSSPPDPTYTYRS